jgi:hypothetical protein
MIDTNETIEENIQEKGIEKNDKGVEFYPISGEFKKLSGENVQWCFRVKEPPVSAIDRFQAEAQKGKAESALNNNLVLSIIWPGDRQEFLNMNKLYPGIGNSIAKKAIAAKGFSGNACAS